MTRIPQVDRERVLIDPVAIDSSGRTTLDHWQPDKEGRLLAYQLWWLKRARFQSDAELVAELGAATFVEDEPADPPKDYPWPQWLGPRRDGVVHDPRLLTKWPARGPKKLWEADGGDGYSSFAADAVQLIADAELRAGGEPGKVDRNALRDVLETAQLDGLSGPIRMTPDNHSGLMPQALTTLVARGGRWRLAG